MAVLLIFLGGLTLKPRVWEYSTRHNDWRQCILKLRPLASKCHKLEVSSSFSSKDMAFNNISVKYGHCQLNIAQCASQTNFKNHGVF